LLIQYTTKSFNKKNFQFLKLFEAVTQLQRGAKLLQTNFVAKEKSEIKGKRFLSRFDSIWVDFAEFSLFLSKQILSEVILRHHIKML
jgi:hypothetical protein